MYIVLSLIPIIFNYAYIFLMPFDIPMLYLIRFFLNWFLFPAGLIWINFINVLTRKIKPWFSVLMSFIVMTACYSAVFIIYFLASSAPLDDFGIKALFLTNLYMFIPFAAVVMWNIIYKLTLGRIIKKRKRKAKKGK